MTTSSNPVSATKTVTQRDQAITAAYGSAGDSITHSAATSRVQVGNLLSPKWEIQYRVGSGAWETVGPGKSKWLDIDLSTTTLKVRRSEFAPASVTVGLIIEGLPTSLVADTGGGATVDVGAVLQAGNDTQRLLSRMTVLPKQSRATLIGTLIASLQTAGVWERLDALYLTAAHDEQAARLNWRGSGAQDLTNINGCTHDPDRGLQGDGATSYLNTALAGNAADNYSRDSAFCGIWSLSNSSNNAWHDISGAGGMYINSRAASGSAAVRCNNSGAASVAAPVSDSLGMTAINRNSATEFQLWRNTELLGTATNASEALTSAVFWVGRNSTNYSGRKLSAIAIGGGLTDAQYLALYAAIRTYLVALGAVS